MRVAALLSFLVLLLPSAFAGLKEADDSLVDSRAHRFLTTLSEKIGTEDTVMAKGRALAVLSLSGCNFNLLVVGPIEGDAHAYARAIDAWRERQGLPGDVEWSQEDDAAAAVYKYRPGRIGLRSAETAIDLPALREAMLRIEPRAQFAVADAAWAPTNLGFAPDATVSAGTRYWNLTQARSGLRPIVGRIAVPAWMPWAIGLWFLLLPVGMLTCFGIGVAVAKNERIPLKRRRALYGKAVTGGSMGLLVMHGLIVAISLPTRALEPLAQLWFGQRFTQLAILIVPLFAIVPMIPLRFVNKVERRLLGPSDEERLQQEAEPMPKREIVNPPKSRLAKLRWPVCYVGFALQLVGLLLPKGFPFRELLSPIGLTLALGSSFMSGFGIKNGPKFVVEPEKLEEWELILRSHVVSMAGRLGMTPPPSRVLTEAIYGRFGAILDKKGVGMTIGALEALAPEEIDFLVAHELAHEKLGHRKRREAVMLVPFVLVLPLLLIPLLGRSLLVSTPSLVFTPMLLIIALMAPYQIMIRRAMQRQEFEADRLAVETTGDAPAARSALRKITLKSAAPGVHDMDMASHPAVGRRLAALGG